MNIKVTLEIPVAVKADTVAYGLFEQEAKPSEIPPAVANLIDSGEAKTTTGHLAHTHIDGIRHIVIGLGKRTKFNTEGVRIAAAKVLQRAQELATTHLYWYPPTVDDPTFAAALVEGTVLSNYRFDHYKSSTATGLPQLSALTLHGAEHLAPVVNQALIISKAQNATRNLQNMAANELTPQRLAERARAVANAHSGLTVEVDDLAGIKARDMRAMAAVAQGSVQEPALITMRYEGPRAENAPLVAFVGKAVTFDTGGISLKPPKGMEEMKFDMSAGAAVLEALGAIAELQLPVRLLGIIGAAENMPSGKAIKPGDIVTAKNGKTIEINNTDAEGRLILADCLAYAVEQGATKILDLATLTGAVIVALGSTYAGLMSNDQDWATTVKTAADRSDEDVWELPLHQEYAQLIEGEYADITNTVREPKALTITAAEFLRNFVDDRSWAHLDIAGVAWNRKRAYTSKAGSGFGVRLLVELARTLVK